MEDVIRDGDEKLISTARGAEISGYSKDYIGQLCREEKIECRRVSNQWYLHEGSLREYQGIGAVGQIAPNKVPITVPSDATGSNSITEKRFSLKVGNVRNDTFTYDEKEYISTARAADITGYTQDYVGQLARGDEVDAKKVGRRWFVAKQSLLRHKKENDAQLGSVQASASGLTQDTQEGNLQMSSDAREVSEALEKTETPVRADSETERSNIHFNVRYISETNADGALPKLERPEKASRVHTPDDISIQVRDTVEKKESLTARNHVSGLSELRTLAKRDDSRETRGKINDGVRVNPRSKKVTTSLQNDVKLHTKDVRKTNVYLLFSVLLVILLGAAVYAYFFFDLTFNVAIFNDFTASITDWLRLLFADYIDYIPAREVTY